MVQRLRHVQARGSRSATQHVSGGEAALLRNKNLRPRIAALQPPGGAGCQPAADWQSATPAPAGAPLSSLPDPGMRRLSLFRVTDSSHDLQRRIKQPQPPLEWHERELLWPREHPPDRPLKPLTPASSDTIPHRTMPTIPPRSKSSGSSTPRFRANTRASSRLRFVGRPALACIRSMPRYRVAQLRFSMSLKPWTISHAHGCRMTITFMPGTLSSLHPPGD
jgi:hypothetical protein